MHIYIYNYIYIYYNYIYYNYIYIYTVNISKYNNIRIIIHTRKSLLFNNNRAWTKRNNTNTFDVTMGSFDGAEICEQIGLFILHSLENRFGKKIGLYRDDGLAAINTTSGRLEDKARKDLIRIFESFGLKITAHANLKRVNFLDITFDITNGTYGPYRKPNVEPLCINRLSNHQSSDNYHHQ